MELNDTSAQRVNDVYSELAKITATNTGDLATAMSKTASIANSANMSFENTAAFLAQILETTQEAPEVAGTALKTVIGRIGEIKKLYTSGQLMGTDDEGEEINVNKVSTALRAAGINLNEFFTGAKGLDEILFELAERWDTLDLTVQRYISTQMAGSRQQSRMIALLSNSKRLAELMNAAETSEGSAEGQFEKTLESLQAKINKLTDAWEEFLMGIADSDLIKGAIDLLTKLLEVINKLTKGTGSIDSAIMKIALVATAMQAGSTFLQGGLGFVNARRYSVQAQGMAQAGMDASAIQQATGLTDANQPIGSLWSYIKGAFVNFGNLGFIGMAKETVKDIFSGIKGVFTNKSLLNGTAQATLMGDMSDFFTKLNPNLAGEALQQTVDSGLKYTKAAGIWTQLGSGFKAGKAIGDMGSALETVGTEAGGAATGLAKFGTVIGSLGLPGIAVIVGTLATIGIAKAVTYENSAQKKLDDINKALEKTEERLTTTKENLDVLINFKDSSNSLKEQLSELVRGTSEFNEKLIESNELVLDLLSRYSTLKLGTTGDYGELTIDEESLKALQELEKQGYLNLQASQIQQQNDKTIAEAEVALEQLQDVYTYKYGRRRVHSSGLQENQLSLRQEWNAYINDATFGQQAGASFVDYITKLIDGSQISDSMAMALLNGASAYEKAQANIASAKEATVPVAVNNYLAQNADKLTEQQQEDISNRANLLNKEIDYIDSNLTNAELTPIMQKIYGKDALGNEIYKTIASWEDRYKAIFGVSEIPSAFKNDDGTVDEDAIRSAIISDAMSRQIDTLNSNLDKLINGIDENTKGLRDTNPEMADRLERMANGSLTKADIEWLSNDANRNSQLMSDIATGLGYDDTDAFYDKYLQEVIDHSNATFTNAEETYKKLTKLDFSNDTIGRDLTSAMAKTYTDVLEQAYVRQGNLGISNIQGFISGIAGDDPDKISQVIQALSSVDDLGDATAIDNLFKSLESMGLFAGKSKKEILALKNQFIALNGAVKKLSFDQLKEQIQSVGQIINKINLGDQDNIFSEDDKETILGLNPDLENDFYENLDGSFTYLGGSMDNLASVLRANTEALLKENLGQAKTGITLASAFENGALKLADKDADKGQWLNEARDTIASWPDGTEILNQLGLNSFTDYATEISDETVANLYAKVAGYNGTLDLYKEQYRDTSLRINGLNMQSKSAWDLYSIGQDKTLGGYIKNGVITNVDDAKTYASTYLNALIAKNKDYGLSYGSTLQAYAQQAQNVDWSNASQALAFMGNLTNVAKEIAQTYGEINGRALQDQIGESKEIINDTTEAPNKRQAQYSEIATAASTYYGTAVTADFVKENWDTFQKILLGGTAAEQAATAIRQALIDGGALAVNEVKPEDFAQEVEQQIDDIVTNGTKPAMPVGADTTEAEQKAGETANKIDNQEADIDVGANTEKAEEEMNSLSAKQLFTDLEVSLTGAETAEEKIQALAKWIADLTDTPLAFTITGQVDLTDVISKFSDLINKINEVMTTVNNMSSGIMSTAMDIDSRFEQLQNTLSLATELVDEPDEEVEYRGIEMATLSDGTVIAGPGNSYIMKIPQFRVDVKKNENTGTSASSTDSTGSTTGSTSGKSTKKPRGGSDFVGNTKGVTSISKEQQPTNKNKKTIEDPVYERESAVARKAGQEYIDSVDPRLAEIDKSRTESKNDVRKGEVSNPDTGKTETKTNDTTNPGTGDFTNSKDVGNFGKYKGNDSGSSSKDNSSNVDEDKWKNSYDWLYNLTQDINAELEKREKLEIKYDNILKDRNKTAKELYENTKAQLDSLEKSRSLNAEAYEKRKAELQLEAKQATTEYTNGTRFDMKWGTGLTSGSSSSSSHVINLGGSSSSSSSDSSSTQREEGVRTMLTEAELGHYATYNWDDNTIEINWDAINKITDQQKGEAIEDYISKLEEIQEKMNEAEKSLLEIDGQIRDLVEQGKDEYQDFEQQIFDALVSRYQKEIDALSEINDSINDANSKLIDSMEQTIEKERQARDNEETETELADKQKRLDYLRSDTSNANAKEILDLQKELEEGQRDYTDDLIDQKIDELKEQNDKAAEQRQTQIDLMTKNLEMAQETGALWQEVYNLMDIGVDQEGALVRQSELFNLLQSEAGWAGMSAVARMTWLDELTETVKAGMAYLMTGRQLEYIGIEAGKQIEFTAQDENGNQVLLSGTVDAQGNVIDSNGVRYSEVYQNYDGSFTTMERAGVGTKAPEVKKDDGAISGGSTSGSGSGSRGTGTTPRIDLSGKDGIILNPDGTNSGISVWEPGQGVSNAEIRAARDYDNLGKYDENGDGLLSRSEMGKLWKGEGINPKDSKYEMAYDKENDKYYKKYPTMKYKTGGLNTQTGPAWLDGTFSKPELVLNSQDTENFLDLRDLLRAIQFNFKHSNTTVDGNKNNGDNYYEIDINVDSIANDYDVSQMADKIKKLIAQDALYRNGNAINRLR